MTKTKNKNRKNTIDVKISTTEANQIMRLVKKPPKCKNLFQFQQHEDIETSLLELKNLIASILGYYRWVDRQWEGKSLALDDAWRCQSYIISLIVFMYSGMYFLAKQDKPDDNYISVPLGSPLCELKHFAEESGNFNFLIDWWGDYSFFCKSDTFVEKCIGELEEDEDLSKDVAKSLVDFLTHQHADIKLMLNGDVDIPNKANVIKNVHCYEHRKNDSYEIPTKLFKEQVNKLNDKFCPSEDDKQEAINDEVMSIAQEFLEKYKLQDIYDYISTKVYKQDRAKRAISLLILNHMNRLAYPKANIAKYNYMLIGPTGSGKTEIIRAISDILPVPVIIVDMACVTAEGWKGQSLSDNIKAQYKQLENKALIDYAIFVFDEADKILNLANTEHWSATSTEMQSNLLKFLEDGDFRTDNGNLLCKTKHTSTIFVGAFTDVLNSEEIKVNSFNKNHKQRSDTSNLIYNRLIDAGMMPELVGRLSDYVFVDELSAEDYLYIIKNLNDSYVDKVMNEFKLNGVNLSFTPNSLREIAAYAKERNLGVRGATSLIRLIINDKAFESITGPDKDLCVDKNMVKSYMEQEL